jgi:hypothetical protein
MTQAGNLRNYGKSLATEPMTTRAVDQGETLSFRGPDGVGHSPSGPNRLRESLVKPALNRGDPLGIEPCTTLERRGR